MNLNKLAKAVSDVHAQTNHSVLVYGPPKSGKTRLVGTAAKIPEIKRIFWFDIENGVETLINMGLTEEEMEKVTVIKVPNTRDNPIAIETILRAFSAKTPVHICDTHGKVGCVECSRIKDSGIMFSLGTCTHSDLVVIDSGSELGDSALAASCLGKGDTYKPQFDDYGACGKWLGDVLSVIQQCRYTNFVVITHEIALEDDDGKDKIFPLMGTKPFSMKVAKYFGTVAYVHKKLNKHAAGTSSTYAGNVLTGSRVNALLEKSKEPSMRDILVTGGIIKEGIHAETILDKEQEKDSKQGETSEVVKPLTGLAAKLAANRAIQSKS
jgi:hypothetical protein